MKKDLGVFAIMLVVEFLEVTINTVSKAAMTRGMNDFVFVMYSNAFGACFLLPLTLIFFRKQTLQPLTYRIVGQLFVVGLLRMEKLDYKSNSTLAKSFGTLVSITGALIITLYKGQAIINNHHHSYNKLLPYKLLSSSMQFDWVLGAVLLAAHSCFLSLMYIVKTWLIRDYPAELMVTLIRNVLVSMLSVPAVLISTRDSEAWRLRLDMELLAIGCSAIFTVSFRSVVHIWAMGKKGPIFVAMFKPLQIVFAVIMGITFLGDSLYIGSVIRATIVVIGFYGVIWGKAQEEKVEENCEVYSSTSNSPEVPLLQSKRMEG